MNQQHPFVNKIINFSILKYISKNNPLIYFLYHAHRFNNLWYLSWISIKKINHYLCNLTNSKGNKLTFNIQFI